MTPTRRIGLPPFFLQHGRMPRDPNSLALIEGNTAPRGYKEQVVDLVRSIKIWRDTAARNRQKYKDYMQKQYNQNENVPEELTAGELVYVHTPFLNSKYQGIRRLNIQARGPFVIVEMIQGRLARLARVSDLTELPRLVNIKRLRVTKLGLDPPKFDENCELSPENYDDWIPHESEVNQPWDQEDHEEERQCHPSGTELRAERPNDPAENADEGDVRPHDGTCEPEQTEFMDVRVRLPAPIRVTRARKPATEPTFRDVVKILKGTWDPQGNLWLKILCRGDSKSRAFWVDRVSLVGKDVEAMLSKVKIKRTKVVGDKGQRLQEASM